MTQKIWVLFNLRRSSSATLRIAFLTNPITSFTIREPASLPSDDYPGMAIAFPSESAIASGEIPTTSMHAAALRSIGTDTTPAVAR